MGRHINIGYGLSDELFSLLLGLSEGVEDCKTQDLVFHCHVNIIADGLSEWIKTSLSFREMLVELAQYHLVRSAEESELDFSIFPFLDGKQLGTYSLYFFHPKYATDNINTCLKISILQSLL